MGTGESSLVRKGMAALLACVIAASAGIAVVARPAQADEGVTEELADVKGVATEDGELQAFAGEDVTISTIQSGATPEMKDDAGIEGTIKAGDLGLTQEQIDGVTNTLLTAMANAETFRVSVDDYDVNFMQFEALFAQVINLYPEFDYVQPTFHYSGGSLNHIEAVLLEYSSDAGELMESVEKVNDAISEVLEWVPANASRMEQIKAVHDWLVRNVAYNRRASQLGYDLYGVTPTDNPWSAYGALVRHSAVCQGYALAMTAVLKQLDIPCEYCWNRDKQGEGHVWNYVQVEPPSDEWKQGVWFHVDVTWDDPVPDRGFSTTPSTKYFLKSNRYLRNLGDGTHDRWDSFVSCWRCPYWDRNQDRELPSTWPTYSGPVSNNMASKLVDLSSAQVAPIPDQPYDGYECHPLVEVTLNGKTLSNVTDYRLIYHDNIEVGEATVVIQGRNNYRGTIEKTFKIVDKVSFADCDVAPIPDMTYTGNALEPELDVSYDPHGTFGSYTVSSFDATYSNNVNVGTAKVLLTADGTGIVSGSRTVTFKIVPANMSDVVVEDVADQAYTGSELKPVPEVSYYGKTLKNGTDYTISYKNNTKVGEATFTLKGKGNFTGTLTGSFKIVAASAPDPDPDPESESPFIDVVSSPKPTSHYDDILWLADQEISKGWTLKDGTCEFRPNAPVARGDMAAFLFRLAKRWGVVDDSWTPDSEDAFVDVTSKTAHSTEILWMAEEGISTGWIMPYGAEFRPNEPVKRGQMAAFMYRMAVNVGWREGDWPSSQSFFRDVNAATSFHDEIWWLAGNGVTQGWGSGTSREYRPNANVARGDMAAFLHRLDGVE